MIDGRGELASSASHVGPMLLVSVRSSAEVAAALDGGAGIIDIKEPARGPMGRADDSVWREVIDTVARRVPVTVALGEIVELASSESGFGLSGAERDELLGGMLAAKAGFSGFGDGAISAGIREARRWVGPATALIPVAYGDWGVARSPNPWRIFELAREEGLGGIVLDTWAKPATGFELTEWADWSAAVRMAGMRVWLAGGLGERSIGAAVRLGADVVGVRGAACGAGARTGMVDAARVRGLRRALDAAWSSRGDGVTGKGRPERVSSLEG